MRHKTSFILILRLMGKELKQCIGIRTRKNTKQKQEKMKELTLYFN